MRDNDLDYPCDQRPRFQWMAANFSPCFALFPSPTIPAMNVADLLHDAPSDDPPLPASPHGAWHASRTVPPDRLANHIARGPLRPTILFAALPRIHGLPAGTVARKHLPDNARYGVVDRVGFPNGLFGCEGFSLREGPFWSPG